MSKRHKELASLAIAMRKQLDVELLREHFLLSESLRVTLATVDLEEVQEFCSNKSVSLMILDFGFPNRSACEIGNELLVAGRTRKLLLIDGQYNPLRAELAQSAQAAYCSRSISLNNFTEYVESLAYGYSLDPSRVKELVNHDNQLRTDCPHSLQLTKRELEVWTLLAEGLSVPRCATQLGITTSTVDNHKSRLMKKLDIHKSIELTRLAIKAGIVDV